MSREPVDLSVTHGVWEGEEVLHPGPGIPERIEAAGRAVVSAVLDGSGTSSEYTHRRGGEIALSAHIVVIPSSRDEEDVSMHWMSAVEKTVVYRGRFRDGIFRLRADTNGIHMLLEQDYSESGVMRSRSHVGTDPNDLPLVFEGTYHRRPSSQLGTFAWHDLTVDDAPRLRDFYADVLGWTSRGVSMGSYEDFDMVGPDGTSVGGVCHARGPNTDLPPVWIGYVIVEDLDHCLQKVQAGGGRVVAGPKAMDAARYAIVADPAGATIGLYQEG